MAGTIAVFKPSTAGIHSDLIRIKKSEVLAWGGFRSRLAKLYKEAAGTEFIDGVEVFKNMNLRGIICDKESAQYKMLKLLGFTKEDLQELCDVDNDNDLDSFKIKWTGTEDFAKDSWDMLIENFATQTKTFDRIELESSPIKYKESEYTEEERLPIYSNQFGVNFETEETTRKLNQETYEDWEDDGNIVTGEVSKEVARNSRLMNFFSVKLYKNNTDVSQNYTDNFKKSIISLILLEGENLFHSLAKESEEVIDGEFIVKKQKEIFSNNFDKIYMKNKYESYTIENPDTESEELRIAGVDELDLDSSGQTSTFRYIDAYWSFIWQTQNEIGGEDVSEESEGLFVSVGGYTNWEGDTIGGEQRMTVEGLKRSKPGIFGYYVSKFMKVFTKVDKGGFLKRFFMGLIRAFGALIDAILGIIEKLPVFGLALRLTYKLISKVFGISYDEARHIVSKIVTVIVAIIITIYIGGSDGGSMIATAAAGLGVSAGVLAGLITASTWASRILSIYNAIRQAQLENSLEEQDKEKKKEAVRKKKLAYENPEHKAMQGTMGTYSQHQSSNEIMYDRMFNPFFNFEQAVTPEEYKID